MVRQIDSDQYVFRLKSDFNDYRTAYSKIEVILQREADNMTLVIDKSGASLVLYITLIIGIPWIAFIVGVTSPNFLPGFILAAAYGILATLLHRKTSKRMSASILALFKPIQKGKEGGKVFTSWMIPLWSWEFQSLSHPDICVDQLQRLIFKMYWVDISALEEGKYAFRIDQIIFGARAIGTLSLADNYATDIQFRIGIPFVSYSPILFFLLFSLVMDSPPYIGWLFAASMIVIFFAPTLTILCLWSAFRLKNTIRKAVSESTEAAAIADARKAH